MMFKCVIVVAMVKCGGESRANMIEGPARIGRQAVFKMHKFLDDVTNYPSSSACAEKV